MGNIEDRPPVPLVLMIWVFRLLTWSRTHVVELGVTATGVAAVAIRLTGPQWWAAILCGVLFGVLVVLLVRPTADDQL